jgi:hypothetical protein
MGLNIHTSIFDKKKLFKRLLEKSTAGIKRDPIITKDISR